MSTAAQTQLWSSSMDYTIRVWSLESNTVVKTFTSVDGGHANQIACLAKSDDNRIIASGGMDSMLIVYEAATMQVLYKGNQGGIVAAVSCVTRTPEGESC
jgi:WD40 repeat protein